MQLSVKITPPYTASTHRESAPQTFDHISGTGGRIIVIFGTQDREYPVTNRTKRQNDPLGRSAVTDVYLPAVSVTAGVYTTTPAPPPPLSSQHKQ